MCSPPCASSSAPTRAGSRSASRRPRNSTASSARPSPRRSGTPAAPTGTSTRRATTPTSGPGSGAPIAGGRGGSRQTHMSSQAVDLVLEGGGVKGIGLVGALSVLEERGWEPACVAGTSAGAITAALLAAGYSSEEEDNEQRRYRLRVIASDVSGRRLLALPQDAT